MGLGFKFPDAWSCECGKDHRIPIRQILIEENCLLRLGDVTDYLGLGKRCLIVEDSVTRGIAGLKVRKALEDAGHSVSEAIIEKTDMENAARVKEQLKGCDFSVAVGGGTPIDMAKAAANDSRVPFISVPTAPSHDGIASPIVSIIQKTKKTSLLASPPVAVVADLKILSGAPVKMISAGYGDVAAKIVSLKDWEMGRDETGEYYCNRAAELAFQAAHDLMKFSGVPSGKEAIRSLVEALLNCGASMIIAGSSRPCSGSEHLFSHFLDLNAPQPARHGEQCGLGAILMAKYHEEHNPNWWRQPEFQWHGVRYMLHKLGATVELGGLGISKDLAARALVEGARIRPDRYTILHKRPPTLAEAMRLLEETAVI
jgi:glycerol-1-phosphate dehydrogenase [NAD(P)+]